MAAPLHDDFVFFSNLFQGRWEGTPAAVLEKTRLKNAEFVITIML